MRGVKLNTEKVIDKWKRFINSQDKWITIKMQIRMRWQNCFWGPKFGTFGRNSVIYKPDRVLGRRHIFLGRGVCILHHARMETVTEYRGQRFDPKLTIGDRTSIGQNFHVVACGDLVIGRDVTISGNVFIADCFHSYEEINANSMDQKLCFQKTGIGDYSFIGYGAAIQAGAVLGKQCIVGANAVVLKGCYPDYSVLTGVPAKVVKRYNSETKKWEQV